MSNSLNDMRREFEDDFLGVRAHEEAYNEAMEVVSVKPCGIGLKKNKYQREIKQGIYVDVYDVLKAFKVTNSATQHAIKKLLAGGQRGHKDLLQDLNEARDSISRAIELEMT